MSVRTPRVPSILHNVNVVLTTSYRRWCLFCALSSLALLLAGCGYGSPNSPTTSPLAMAVLPSSAQIGAGSTQQYTATVKGSANTAVTWLVNNIKGGNPTVGTISSAGLFTAPASPAADLTESISAVSAADPSNSTTVPVEIIRQGLISVSVAPTSVTVQAGLTGQFAATVTGTSNTAVTWSVNNIQGGNSSVGTISAIGLFSAPATVPANPSVTISATSNQDPTKSAAATAVIAPPSSPGADYYIAPGGSDSNDGSEAHPWATITHADSVLQLGAYGTTVHVAPGTYYYSSRIITNKSGTTAARIRWLSDVQWGAQIRSTDSWAIWYNYGNYVDIVGFELIGTGSTGSMMNGIISHATSHSRYIGNKIHDIPGSCSNSSGGAGIANATFGATTPPRDEQDIGNVIYNIGMANSPGQCQLIHGIYNETVAGIVYNNIVSNVTSFGIETYHSATQQNISNNTVFNTGGGSGGGGIQITCRSGEGGVTSNDYSTIDNNIVVNTGGYGISEYPAVGTHNVYRNNIVIGSYTANVHLLSGAQSGSITSGSPGDIFVDYQSNGSGDYHLKSGSIAIDAGSVACASGVTNCVPTLDIEGGMRPIDSVWDVGAYEFGSAAGTWPWE